MFSIERKPSFFLLFICFNTKRIDIKLIFSKQMCRVTKFRSSNFYISKRLHFLFCGSLIFIKTSCFISSEFWGLLGKIPCLFIIFGNCIYLVSSGFNSLSFFIYFLELIFISFIVLLEIIRGYSLTVKCYSVNVNVVGSNPITPSVSFFY